MLKKEQRWRLKFRVVWDVACVVALKLTDVSEVRTVSALMMEAVRTSETSVNINVTTLRYIP
jgi:hypothetical protein